MLLTQTAREKTLFAGWIVLNSVLICFLLFVCIPQLADFLYGKKDGWIGDLVQYLYPRFGVEKHRFDPAFFIGKAYQFVWRYILFLFIPVTCIGFYKPFRNRFFAFFKPQETAALQPYLPFLVIVLFLFLYDSISDLLKLRDASVFYTPVGAIRWLMPVYPAAWVIYGMYIVFLLSLVCMFLRKTRLAASIYILLYLLFFQTCLFGFEKTDHHFATLTYTGMLLCFWCWYDLNEYKPTKWPLQMIRVAIALPYFLSGIEKILNSGTHWIDASNFKWFLHAHPAPFGEWVSSSDVLCTLLPVVALSFQLSFILILWKPNMRWPLIVAGILFHVGNYLLFGIGYYIHPWYCLYFFYFEPEELRRFINGTYLYKRLYLKSR